MFCERNFQINRNNRFENIKHKPNTTQFKPTPHLRRLRNYGQLTLHNHRIKSLVQSTKKKKLHKYSTVTHLDSAVITFNTHP